MKIYIAGKMTGVKNYNFDKFNKIENKLCRLGHEIINPAKISIKISEITGKKLDAIPRKLFIKTDIYELLECDAIFMLKSWIFSKGARLEHRIAKA